ncbi:MAG: DEAD/DEAH box helicase [Alphaproteobacteria bacterium]|jgi:superfamily II DNA/RNA helicase|nr:DEAD/DEAH box helicase [Alphaproteobacteria bacterium]
MTKKFDTFDISKQLKTKLAKMNYITATDIQAQTIPVVLAGKDILASSQTGTGKTAAFLIPILTLLTNNKGHRALIIAPTRELAKQVWSVANEMMGTNKHTALLIGGDSMPKQVAQLKHNPKLIIGTPGRINDHLSKRKSLKLDNAHYLILDETDRMLDMGFGVQIDEIITHMPKEKQTIMFSATLPKGIIKVSEKYLKDPARISSGEANTIVDKIKEKIINTEERFEELIKELKRASGSVIIFARTQRNTEKLHTKLHKNTNYKADYLHGGLRQNKRERVVKRFRDAKFKILIATDVASRGLDIPHIDHVINYDLPDSPEDYIHRIGRTARAGKEGESISIISRKDEHKWCAIQRFLQGEESSPKDTKKKRKKKKKTNSLYKKNKKGNPGKDKKTSKRDGHMKNHKNKASKNKGKRKS